MKFGVREICDVVFKAKAAQKVGNKVFYKGEPVIYFDTLKTSTLEGAATTVYAQGGRGNSRLVAWEGERTVTFTMEDALISPAGFMILSGAGLVEPSGSTKILNERKVRQTVSAVKKNITVEGNEKEAAVVEINIEDIKKARADGTKISYNILIPQYDPETSELTSYFEVEGIVDSESSNKFEIVSEYFNTTAGKNSYTVEITYNVLETIPANTIPVHCVETTDNIYRTKNANGTYAYIIAKEKLSIEPEAKIYAMIKYDDEELSEPYIGTIVTDLDNLEEIAYGTGLGLEQQAAILTELTNAKADGRLVVIKDKTDVSGAKTYEVKDNNFIDDTVIVILDYYTDKASGIQQIEITPDKFGGNYYVEASTLFRNTAGVDMPAEFIIPNCKVQSNFTFTMASSGDPSTFTFTLDAFPDYTPFDKTKKVLCAIQILDGAGSQDLVRTHTNHLANHEKELM